MLIIAGMLLRAAMYAARLWTRLYTLGLSPRARGERLMEIESDLWEGQHDCGRPVIAAETIARLLAGVPDDILWRIEQSSEAGAGAVAPVPRGVTASAFTCSLAIHLLILNGIVWWASWPTERSPARGLMSQRHLVVEEPPLVVDAPSAVFESSARFTENHHRDVVMARGFPSIGVAGAFVTPVSGFSQQPIHLPGTWTLDLSRSDPHHDWQATVPSGEPPPPPPPSADSLTITRIETDLVVDQKWDDAPGMSQSTSCVLVDVNTFAARSRETMPGVPSTLAFWDGTQAMIRVMVSLRLPRDVSIPVELRMRYRADGTTLTINSETRMPNGVYTRRFVYSRQN